MLVRNEYQNRTLGGDIRQLANFVSTKKFDSCRDFFYQEYTLDYKIWNYPKPILSIWDGVTMGGGIGISAGSKYRIATDKTLWAMPEVQKNIHFSL